MATRETAYRKFGPKLLEAIVLLVKDEINVLRVNAGLSERTDQQLVDALQAKWESLPKYSWMD